MLEVAELVTTFLGWLGGASAVLMLTTLTDPNGSRRSGTRYGALTVLLAIATLYMLYAY